MRTRTIVAALWVGAAVAGASCSASVNGVVTASDTADALTSLRSATGRSVATSVHVLSYSIW